MDNYSHPLRNPSTLSCKDLLKYSVPNNLPDNQDRFPFYSFGTKEEKEDFISSVGITPDDASNLLEVLLRSSFRFQCDLELKRRASQSGFSLPSYISMYKNDDRTILKDETKKNDSKDTNKSYQPISSHYFGGPELQCRERDSSPPFHGLSSKYNSPDTSYTPTHTTSYQTCSSNDLREEQEIQPHSQPTIDTAKKINELDEGRSTLSSPRTSYIPNFEEFMSEMEKNSQEDHDKKVLLSLLNRLNPNAKKRSHSKLVHLFLNDVRYWTKSGNRRREEIVEWLNILDSRFRPRGKRRNKKTPTVKTEVNKTISKSQRKKRRHERAKKRFLSKNNG